jgi:hypothetical protein
VQVGAGNADPKFNVSGIYIKCKSE